MAKDTKGNLTVSGGMAFWLISSIPVYSVLVFKPGVCWPQASARLVS